MLTLGHLRNSSICITFILKSGHMRSYFQKHKPKVLVLLLKILIILENYWKYNFGNTMQRKIIGKKSFFKIVFTMS